MSVSPTLPPVELTQSSPDRFVWGSPQPPAGAALAWAAVLLAPNAQEAHRTLSDAASNSTTSGKFDLGRCLTDLAEVAIRLGRDASGSLIHARNILDASGAALFIQEVE